MSENIAGYLPANEIMTLICEIMSVIVICSEKQYTNYLHFGLKRKALKLSEIIIRIFLIIINITEEI